MSDEKENPNNDNFNEKMMDLAQKMKMGKEATMIMEKLKPIYQELMYNFNIQNKKEMISFELNCRVASSVLGPGAIPKIFDEFQYDPKKDIEISWDQLSLSLENCVLEIIDTFIMSKLDDTDGE